ncbi:tetrapyrrole methylase [Xylariaceae sp. FL1019]|nr:tetrapyrrole methylase [Xylariaceae sp. FL1019]
MAFLQTSVSASVSDNASRKGELVVVGTGLASVRQLTLEAISYIESADSVFYLVSDLCTGIFIQEHSKNTFDLHSMYETTKNRFDSYIQMAELMLRKVRQGELVVGVFYGHPGVFVNPSHRAIYVRGNELLLKLYNIAREEGYKAKMLPGISAEDCLFADLGIDPATSSCVSHEASSLLLHKKTIDTSSHLIVWQPGAVGAPAMQFENKHFLQLIDHLEEHYGTSHPLINYVAATSPMQQSCMDRHTIGEMRDPDVVKTVTPASTFYIPPKDLPLHDLEFYRKWTGTSVNEISQVDDLVLAPTSVFRMVFPERKTAEIYGEHELKVIQRMDESGAASKQTSDLPNSDAFRKALIQLALDHHRLEGLEPQERLVALGDQAALLSPRERALIEAELGMTSVGNQPITQGSYSSTVVVLILVAASNDGLEARHSVLVA